MRLLVILVALAVPVSVLATVQLTTPITVQNVTRIKVESYRGNDDHAVITVSLRPNAGGDDENTQRAKAYRTFELTIRDAPALSEVLKMTTSSPPPAGVMPINPYTGQVCVVLAAVPSAFTHIVDAITNASPKTPAAVKKAIENQLVADGIIFGGTVQ